VTRAGAVRQKGPLTIREANGAHQRRRSQSVCNGNNIGKSTIAQKLGFLCWLRRGMKLIPVLLPLLSKKRSISQKSKVTFRRQHYEGLGHSKLRTRYRRRSEEAMENGKLTFPIFLERRNEISRGKSTWDRGARGTTLDESQDEAAEEDELEEEG